MVIAVGSRTVSPGREAEWEALWVQMVELARAQPGFRAAQLLRSKEHNGKYTVLTEWESERLWERYYALPAMQELTRRSFALFAAAPIQEWHVVVSDVRADG